MSRLAFVVAGHVGHGKSTLVGRLLAETGALQQDRVERIQRMTEARFHWRGRDYLVIDAPGHQEFHKNMITGAAHADAALLLVDAKEGVQEQSCRHAYLLSFLGIKHVAVVVSKMDLVDYSQTALDRISDDCAPLLASLKLQPVAFIPVSAKDGDNLIGRSDALAWYHGPSLLEVLERLPAGRGGGAGPLRIPVQDVYTFDERCIIAGRIESGRLQPGDEIQVWPSGQQAHVSSIEAWPKPQTAPITLETPQTVGLTLDQPLFVQPGDILADPLKPPLLSNLIAATIFWLGRTPLSVHQPYQLRLAATDRTVEVFSITRVINAASMQVEHGASHVRENEAAEVVLRTARPLIFDPAADVASTGRFVILDGSEVVGGGVIIEAEEVYRRLYRDGLPKSTGISPIHADVTTAHRALAYGHKSHVIWLTGVPGVGKSTLARHLERQLFDRQVKTFVLDGENLRFGLSADLGFTDADRSEQARRAGEVARLFQLAGLVVIVALVTPFDADREYVRTLVGDDNFTLIHLDAAASILRERDPHGLYSEVARGADVAVPGLNALYEPPATPTLRIDTGATSVHSAVARLLDLVLTRVRWAPTSLAPSSTTLPTTSPRRGVCVWLTGLSGAGKSTIAEALAARLKERGREVTLLDGDVVRTHLSKGLGFTRADRDANARRIAFVAGAVAQHDGLAICAVVSPYQSTREECRRLVGNDRFVLVHVSTPLAVCELRDPKGMYARARRGEIQNFTGIDDPYEPPTAPDLVLATVDCTPDANARLVLEYLERHGFLSVPPEPAFPEFA